MNYARLEANIIDMMEEQQLKLGYMKETLRLYYPLTSLNRFLELECSVEDMKHCMQMFCKEVEPRLGRISVSNKGERFCVVIPPEGVEYVHVKNTPNQFLAELIEMVRKHGTTMEEVLDLFSSHSSNVIQQKMFHGEFDYLVYFKDGKPDAYYYCLANEGHHVTYHRYTKEDYEDFGF